MANWDDMAMEYVAAGAKTSLPRSSGRPEMEPRRAVYGPGLGGIAAQRLARTATQKAVSALHNLLSGQAAELRRARRRVTFDSQMSNLTQLISNQEVLADDGFGKVADPDGRGFIYAVDKYGTLVQEALMLYYDDEPGNELPAEQYYSQPVRPGQEPRGFKAKAVGLPSDFRTRRICHIDLAPEVSLSSSSNLVLTQVQGRDYTRKELVSGGDMEFSVSGNICCDLPGVYPSMAVQKFSRVMRRGGILQVSHYLFSRLGVSRVLVKDYRLERQECMNMQPYSFTCVAVEPDDVVAADTIRAKMGEVRYALPPTPFEALLLDQKKRRVLDNAATDLASKGLKAISDAAR